MAEHAESLLPAGKNWQLIWHDEFDGTQLDTGKWDFRLHLMQQRHNTFTDSAAGLDGQGNLILSLQEKDGQYYSSQLQTGSNYLDRPGARYASEPAQKTKFTWPVAKLVPAKFMHRYGYYEIRCKFQQQPGWWSAFWLQSPVIGSSLKAEEAGVEVDIMENFTRDGEFSHNLYHGGYGEDFTGRHSGPRKISGPLDGYHWFGLDWTPEEYIFYADGQETFRCGAPVSQREQFILLSTECMGYRKGDQPAPELKRAQLPDAFVVDFVRVYDQIS